MAILESGEMYVETIYILSLESDKVRGKDISNHIGVTRPSVSRALNSLREKGLVKNDKNGNIRLTEGGIILAKHIYERHRLFARHLMDLGVDEKTASEDAGRIERFISDASIDAIRTHLIKSGSCNSHIFSKTAGSVQVLILVFFDCDRLAVIVALNNVTSQRS